MVKLRASTYKRIAKQIARWGGEVPLTDTSYCEKGECDICMRNTWGQLLLQEHDMVGEVSDTRHNDPGWVLCLYHAREVGLAW